MNAFLEKHGIDVGKVSSVLLWSATFDRIVEMIVAATFQGTVLIRIDAVLTALLAIAMWEKRNWARITLVAALWVVLAAVLIGMLAVPFVSPERIAIVGQPYSTGLYVRMWILVVVCLPVSWIGLAALCAPKTRAEFVRLE